MKRILGICTLLLLLGLQGNAQEADALFERFRGEPRAEYVYVSPFLMQIGKLFCSTGEARGIVSRVRSTKVLDLEDCTEEVRRRLAGEVQALEGKGYELLMQTVESGERVSVWGRVDKDVVRELLVVAIEEGECSLVLLKGKIRKQDIARLVDQEKDKRNGRR